MLTGWGKNESMKEKPLPAHSNIPGTPNVRSTIMPCSLVEPMSVISHNKFAAPVCGPADSSFVGQAGWGYKHGELLLTCQNFSYLFTSIQDAFLSFYGIVSFINSTVSVMQQAFIALLIACWTPSWARSLPPTQWIICLEVASSVHCVREKLRRGRG